MSEGKIERKLCGHHPPKFDCPTCHPDGQLYQKLREASEFEIITKNMRTGEEHKEKTIDANNYKRDEVLDEAKADFPKLATVELPKGVSNPPNNPLDEKLLREKARQEAVNYAKYCLDMEKWFVKWFGESK